MEFELSSRNQTHASGSQWLVLSSIKKLAIVQCLVFSAGLLAMSSAFAGTVITGLSLNVAADDTVTVNNSGTSAFPGGVGTAGNYPYIGGWGHASGTITWTDTNGTLTLRLDDSGIDVLNNNGVANENGVKSGSVQLSGDTTLGATLRATYGVGVSAFTSTIANGSVPFDVTGSVNVAPIPVDLDLSVTKDDGVTEAVPGTQVVYTIVAANAGPGDEDNALITDVFPSGLTCDYTSIAAGGATGNTATGSGSLGDNLAMPSGSSVTYTVTCDIASTATGTIDNTVQISTANNDTDPSNNTASDVNTLTPEADMAMTATDAPDPVVAGSGVGNLVHVLTLSNNGPSDATGSQATIVPVLPAGVTPVSAIPDIGTFDLGTGLWTIGDHPVGVTATLEIILTVDSSTAEGVDVISATGTATANETDTDPSNNTAVDPTTVVREVDMAMTATDTPDPVIAGSGVGNLVHVLTLSNNGPSDASGSQATIVPVLPAGVTPVSAIPDIGTFDLGTGLWTIGVHPAGVTATLEIILTVGSSTAEGVDVISATGTATAIETDTDPSNNSAVDPTSVIRVSDLVAESKTADPDPVAAGAQLTYTLTVVNDGPSDADNVTVTDTLPVGTTHFSNTGGCTEAAGVVTCNLGTLTAGTTLSFDIVVDVDVALANNTVLSNSFSVVSDSEDPDETNNALDPATLTTVVTEAYWDVTKYWNRGGSGSVSITLTCDGIAPVTGVANPGVPTTLTATGWENGNTSCVVTEDVPGGTFEEYSVDCSVDDVVSNTTYICDIGNSESFATFAVRKRFMDGNDETPVTFHMDCNNGLPTEQQLTVFPDTGDFDRGSFEVNFVVTKFAPGEMDCTVYEEPVGGYTASYVCGSVNNPDQECTDGDDSPLDNFGTGPCFFEDVDSSGAFDSINYCTIRNYPNPGEIEITKEWIIEGAGGNLLDLEARVEIVSGAEVEGSYPCRGNQWCTSVNFYGPETTTHTLDVETSFEGTVISLEEDVYDSTFMSENDCGNELTVYPTGYQGNDGKEQCTFTNTAFFEGIPTLNQYGMALLALLMLGVGLAGFRRM